MKPSEKLSVIVATFVLLLPTTQNRAFAQQDQVATEVLTDFSKQNESERWITVNDNVMGGRSKGGPKFGDGKLIFAGSTNTNGGGFSSIRTKPQKWDTSKAEGIIIRVRGDGRTYKADLLTDNKMGRFSIAYRSDFQTKKDEWIEVKVPFDSFKPTLMGSDMTGRTRQLDRAEIQTVGFMIYDGKDGPFRLEVDWIKTYIKTDE
ncbi:MAG: CIA30 family protein [Planctomycetota bacterium]